MATPDQTRLRELRERIDSVDAELVRLLAERMQLVVAVGACKRHFYATAVVDSARERQLHQLWQQRAEQCGLLPRIATDVLQELLRQSHSVQQP